MAIDRNNLMNEFDRIAELSLIHCGLLHEIMGVWINGRRNGKGLTGDEVVKILSKIEERVNKHG